MPVKKMSSVDDVSRYVTNLKLKNWRELGYNGSITLQSKRKSKVDCFPVTEKSVHSCSKMEIGSRGNIKYEQRKSGQEETESADASGDTENMK